MPATPIRITSLAPRTRPAALVPARVKSGKAAPRVAVRWRKTRRVIRFMIGALFRYLPARFQQSWGQFSELSLPTGLGVVTARCGESRGCPGRLGRLLDAAQRGLKSPGVPVIAARGDVPGAREHLVRVATAEMAIRTRCPVGVSFTSIRPRRRPVSACRCAIGIGRIPSRTCAYPTCPGR